MLNRLRPTVVLVGICGLMLTAVFAIDSAAQELPKKIRGYKVQNAEVTVNDAQSEGNFAVLLDFEKPEVESVSPLGMKLGFESGITVSGQSGRVDFISFRDFTVNGIKVSIEEYNGEFEFEKGIRSELKTPIKIYVPTGQALKGMFDELTHSKSEWRVTGRAFVFGRFRKYGFMWKRVVPVDVDFLIPNQIRE